MKHRRGMSAHTLLELLISMLILYLACAYLMSLFSSGWRFGLRSREYSATTFLARNKMEYLSCQSADMLENGGSGRFTGAYSGYSWNASVSDYNGDLKLLTLEVVSPLRTKTTLYRLLRERAFLGVACDEFSDQVIWSTPDNSRVSFSQSSAVSSPQSLSLTLPGIDPCHIGALSGVPGRGIVWSACANRPVIGYFVFNAANKLKTRRLLRAQPPAGLSSPHFTGIAGDRWGNALFCADAANGAVWIAQDSAAGDSLQWSSDSPLRPAKLPLQKPMGVALDENASILWIAESTVRAVRPLYLSPKAKPGGSGAEAVPGRGGWGPRFAPPQGHETFRGLAVNAWGSVLFAVDDQHLNVLTYKTDADGSLSGEWKTYSLPVALRTAMPSGAACDPYKNVVYINTCRGELWMVSVQSAPSFKRVQ